MNGFVKGLTVSSESMGGGRVSLFVLLPLSLSRNAVLY